MSQMPNMGAINPMVQNRPRSPERIRREAVGSKSAPSYRKRLKVRDTVCQ
jgi:hypothetical protein